MCGRSIIKSIAQPPNSSFQSINRLSSNRCLGCGTCAGLCPKNAITMVIDKSRGVYLPNVNKKLCVECGTCLRVCPSLNSDVSSLELSVFGKHPDNPLFGNFQRCYQGYSNNYDIRYNSSSGGLITQLLISALEEKLIDGVLVTKMNPSKPLEPQPFIAKTAEEIITASGSKYCPVPLNIGLKEILHSDGKYAVVGLPCHIQGIRRAEASCKQLKEKILLHLGIFCSHTFNFHATEYLLKTLGVGTEELKTIQYRGGGWPGNSIVETKSNKHYSYPYKLFGRIHILNFFTPLHCTGCFDHYCQLSDISFGDAWNCSFASSDSIGTSIVLSRTKVGYSVLESSVIGQKIRLKYTASKNLIISQKDSLSVKRKWDKFFRFPSKT